MPDCPPKGPPPGWAYTERTAPPPVELAACSTLSPADADRLLFPLRTPGNDGQHLDAGRALCQTCPVQAECLDYALTADEPSGIWGGMGETERHHLRRRLRLPAAPPRPDPVSVCGTARGYTRHRRAGETACVACTEANARYKQDHRVSA